MALGLLVEPNRLIHATGIVLKGSLSPTIKKKRICSLSLCKGLTKALCKKGLFMLQDTQTQRCGKPCIKLDSVGRKGTAIALEVIVQAIAGDCARHAYIYLR